jgi:AbrB family looped-hinge helix DNA binding protein
LKRPDDWIAKLSPNGQVILPKVLRERRGWKAGAEFIVEERPEGVLLRFGPERAKVTIDQVAGCLGPVDRSRTVDEMSEGVRSEFRTRWKREEP